MKRREKIFKTTFFLPPDLMLPIRHFEMSCLWLRHVLASAHPLLKKTCPHGRTYLTLTLQSGSSWRPSATATSSKHLRSSRCPHGRWWRQATLRSRTWLWERPPRSDTLGGGFRWSKLRDFNAKQFDPLCAVNSALRTQFYEGAESATGGEKSEEYFGRIFNIININIYYILIFIFIN